MRKNGFKMSAVIPASPAEIYKAWLSTRGHTAMTGSPASVDGKVGGKFSAWDGYIFGKTLALTPNQRIAQAGASEFLTTRLISHRSDLEEVPGNKITLTHSNIPANQVDSYRQGWEDYYFKPMKEYFR
jgi:activator of HSP90 ATPase